MHFYRILAYKSSWWIRFHDGEADCPPVLPYCKLALNKLITSPYTLLAVTARG